MSTINATQEKKYLWIIGVLSVAIPLAVAFLLFIPQTGKLGDLDVSFLPRLNAMMNTGCAISLMVGFWAIKTGKQDLHRIMMMSAFVLSSIFLISYVVFHFQGAPTLFGDIDHNGVVTDAEKAQVGTMRVVYLVILLSHILLSTVVVPLVLLAIYFAFTNQLKRHTKIVKWTFPIWLYVAITGVVVYLMISPYYH
ncbi:DUF420 domain-containing protein [Sediminitomix flava]|uniref:Putative membrane protein n=1 Tax=Sediminitomix flava TaxID=379075 RepID=A0A315ZAB3_SEDFL|nr:DUF420 domain-containing protein [Sediminitomix flava]PWJ42526.1 putative membrane protein [Sediminitomix flava]